MAGHAVREIACMWVVSGHTVRTQDKSVLAKLDVSNQEKAVVVAWDNGGTTSTSMVSQWVSSVTRRRVGLSDRR
jgi:hypothetical protein